MPPQPRTQSPSPSTSPGTTTACREERNRFQGAGNSFGKAISDSGFPRNSRLPSSDGIEPVSWFAFRSITSRLGRLPISGAISPLTPVCQRAEELEIFEIPQFTRDR